MCCDIAGFLLKDVLTKEMEDYVSGYYTSPGVAGGTQYIPDTSSYSYGDPTRIFDSVNTIDNAIDEDFGNLKFYNNPTKKCDSFTFSSNREYFELYVVLFIKKV